ncbi:MAG: hypothetical protein Q7J35_08855 [Candidatus Methanoperedens sp.]|nr:hypothetical protein [Candidatus Methanoperedens sp.]
MEIGIESGSEAVLKRWNKRTTVEINREAVRVMNELELQIALDFIMFDYGVKMPSVFFLRN